MRYTLGDGVLSSFFVSTNVLGEFGVGGFEESDVKGKVGCFIRFFWGGILFLYIYAFIVYSKSPNQFIDKHKRFYWFIYHTLSSLQ